MEYLAIADATDLLLWNIIEIKPAMKRINLFFSADPFVIIKDIVGNLI